MAFVFVISRLRWWQKKLFVELFDLIVAEGVPPARARELALAGVGRYPASFCELN